MFFSLPRSYWRKIHLPKFKKDKLAFQQTDTQDGKKRCNVIFIFTLQFCHLQSRHDHSWEPGLWGLGTQDEVIDLTTVVDSVSMIKSDLTLPLNRKVYSTPLSFCHKVMKTCLLVAEHSLRLRGQKLLSITYVHHHINAFLINQGRGEDTGVTQPVIAVDRIQCREWKSKQKKSWRADTLWYVLRNSVDRKNTSYY